MDLDASITQVYAPMVQYILCFSSISFLLLVSLVSMSGDVCYFTRLYLLGSISKSYYHSLKPLAAIAVDH